MKARMPAGFGRPDMNALMRQAQKMQDDMKAKQAESTHQAFRQGTAYMLTDMLVDAVQNGTGRTARIDGMTVGGTILFVLVFCIGHALNFALNLIGCFVHTLRLQFLEFFGKWYRDGGKAFRPLKIQTKYVDIKEE